MKRSRHFLFVLCEIGLICSFLFNPRASLGNERVHDEILVMGLGKVVQGNIAAGKSEAISNAMENAMEEYLALRLGEAGMINNFERVVREILPTAMKGIENFHILAENMAGGEYRVLVKVKVNTEVIDAKLRFAGIALEQAPQSKVLFMVSEARGGRLQYWWKGPDSFSVMNQTEVTLYSVFQERGFMPINHTFGIADQSLSPEMKSGELGNSRALEWGKMLSADFVVTGKSILDDDTGVALQLRVLSVKDGVLVGEGSERGQRDPDKEKGEGKNQMLVRVVRKLADRLIPSMVYLKSTAAGGIQHIQVTLKGIRSYKDFKDLQKFLKEDVPGVKSVHRSRMGQGILGLDIAFAGSRDQLLGRLLNQKALSIKLVLGTGTETGIVLLVTQ